MLKLHEIQELIKLIDQSNITKFEYEYEGLKLSLEKDQQNISAPDKELAQLVQKTSSSSVTPKNDEAVPATPNAGVEDVVIDEGLHKIVSPMVGTFYRAPAPDEEPFVKEGDQVTEETVVCIVEAMKLMNEIQAEVKGEIVKVLVENGQLVEYGEPLFLVRVV